MLIKFLGTSSAESLPRAECNCDQCSSKDKKDKRSRSSILINKKILIDANPDIGRQLRPSQVKSLEAVLITHEHQDASFQFLFSVYYFQLPILNIQN